MSPVAAFVRELCDVGPHEVPCEDLYRKWKLWAEDNGHRAGSSATFGRDLRAVIPALQVVRPGGHREADRSRYYQGIRLGSTVLRPLDAGGRTDNSDSAGDCVQVRPGDAATYSPLEVRCDLCDVAGGHADWCGAEP